MAAAAAQHDRDGDEQLQLVAYRLSNGEELEVHVPGSQALSDVAFVMSELFVNNEYLRHGITLQPGATVVDIGAHVGLFGARCLTHVAGGDIMYVAAEPCPPTLAAARANLLGSQGSPPRQHQQQGQACPPMPPSHQQQRQQNSFFHLNASAYGGPVAPAAPGRRAPPWPDNIKLLGKAVCDAPGARAITFYPRTPANATLHPEQQAALLRGLLRPGMLDGAVVYDVPAVTLGQLLAEAGMSGDVDLLKIDAEGSELQVLLGLGGAEWRRLHQVVAEVHDVLDDDKQRAAAAIDGTAVAFVAGADSSPPPRAGGRVLRVAGLLVRHGFRVVIDCPLGVPTNYMLFARRPPAAEP